MTELLHIALRAVGVVLPGAAFFGIVVLLAGALDEGALDGDFFAFLGAMGLSLLAATVWAARDARRASTARVFTRWVATAVVVGVGLGLLATFAAPGSPPGPERVADAVSTSFFFGIPLLMAAGLGVAIGAGARSGVIEADAPRT